MAVRQTCTLRYIYAVIISLKMQLMRDNKHRKIHATAVQKHQTALRVRPMPATQACANDVSNMHTTGDVQASSHH
jgi:hypothetical protein